MTQAILQYGMYLVILVLLAIPLGRYMGKVMNGERVFLSCALVPCERFIYRVMHVRVDEEMSWKKYVAERAAIQPNGIYRPIFDSGAPGSAARQSTGDRRNVLAPFLQYGFQLCDQHQLAGVHRRSPRQAI